MHVQVCTQGGGGVQLLYMVECERSLVYTYLVCTEPICMYVCMYIGIYMYLIYTVHISVCIHTVYIIVV